MANPTDFPKEQVATTITESNIESLGLKLRGQFTTNETYRTSIEQVWLESLRQHNKIYDPDVEAKLDKHRSRVYPGVTRSKNISVEARLHEIAFPDVGRAWGISPTPYSTISQTSMQIVFTQIVGMKQQQVQQYLMQVQQQGQPPDEQVVAQIMNITDEEINKAIAVYAKDACTKMETRIDDQFVETGWIKKAKECMRSGIYLGTGIMKNPMVSIKTETGWKREPGQPIPILYSKEVPTPYLEFVRVWDIYPDMSVVNFEDAEGIFERHVMTKHDLRALAKRPDFRKDKILEYIVANPTGDATFKSWELQLQTLSTELGQFKIGKKYEVLEYWGYVDAADLEEIGVTVSDEEKGIELEANVWILGNVPIKAVLNPMPKGNPTYSYFYYEKDDSSIFGRGLAKIMRDSQETICSAARMMLDNAAITVGDQLEINIDLMDDDQDYDNIHPFKLWFRKGRGVEAQHPAIRNVQMSAHMQDYMVIIKQFMDFADLETAFPTYMLIEPQRMGNETAQGASIRSSTVNITVKDIAKNWDSFVESVVTAMQRWNMEFSDKEEIKGDYAVKATGLSSLVAKEVRAQIMQNLNTVLTDEDRTWIKHNPYLVELWKVLDLPLDMLRTEDEHNEWMQQNTDPEIAQLEKEKIKADIEKTRALALSNTAGAKKKVTDAQITETEDADLEQKQLNKDKQKADIHKTHSEAVANIAGAMQPNKPEEKIEGRAEGGPVEKDEPYIVGEGGQPEIFVPEQDGRIIPNNLLREPSVSEHDFYKANPHVAGMADFEGNSITVNPYSNLSDVEKHGVIRNEHARLIMRNNNLIPDFDVTPEQQQAFKNYGGGDPLAMRETIVGRILSGDKSALNYTPQQKEFADKVGAHYSSWTPNDNDLRRDGTRKGNGWLGALPITYPNGGTGVASEYTVSTKIGDREFDIPTLVPTLTPEEKDLLLTDIIPNRRTVPNNIFNKAVEHAQQRIQKGLSPYKD